MKNTSRGFAWLIPIIIIALLGIGGFTAIELKKSKTADETQVDVNENTEAESNANVSGGSASEARLEFPWIKYDSNISITASSNTTKAIGSSVNAGGFSKADIIIGDKVNLGGSSSVGTVYAFTSLNLAASGNIEKLYVEADTSVNLGYNATVGQKVVLSHNDLVKAAEKAAGISVSAGVNVSASTSITTTTVSPSNPTPSPTPSSSGSVSAIVNFSGEWNGSFSSSPLVAAACKASGDVSLSVASSGSVSGYIMMKGYKVPGTGKVDSNGNLSGSWNYTGINLTYTGKLNSSTEAGSGTYKDALGCFGSFTVNK